MILDPQSSHTMPKILGILGCTKKKIWDRNPDIGPVPALNAYQGTKFLSDLERVETLTTRWIILSAKYGFMDPDFVIPGTYNVTFNPTCESSEPPVPVETLIRQVNDLDLGSFDIVRFFSSCGDLYEANTREAFGNIRVRFERV